MSARCVQQFVGERGVVFIYKKIHRSWGFYFHFLFYFTHSHIQLLLLMLSVFYGLALFLSLKNSQQQSSLFIVFRLSSVFFVSSSCFFKGRRMMDGVPFFAQFRFLKILEIFLEFLFFFILGFLQPNDLLLFCIFFSCLPFAAAADLINKS